MKMDYYRMAVNLLKNAFSFKLSTYILASIIALAFFLRAYRLEDIPAGLYWDEISAVYSPFLYQHGLIDDLSLRVIISHLLPGTYFLFPLSGSSIFLTRLPELISGTLLVFTTYLLAKEMFSVRIGLISALLISVLPWAIHFSRFQAFSSAYVLFFTVTLLLLYKGINSDVERKKVVYYCSGSCMLGLTAMIFSISWAFVLLFLPIFLVIYVRKKDLNLNSIFSKRTMLAIIIFVLTVSPIPAEYFVHSQNSSLAISYSTYSHSKGILDWLNMIIQRSRIHLSPAFLVFTSPSTHDLAFEQMIAKSAQLRYSPTIHGELNFYGLMVYPGILLLIIQSFINRSKTHAVIFWWIVCYSIISGIAYYDNPNAARNIVGMPALAITIALFIDFLVDKICRSKNIHPVISGFFNRDIAIIILTSAVVVPTSLFLHDYYTTYYVESAKVFDYGYKAVADFLSANNMWYKNILINTDFGRNLTLLFYSPIQPPAKHISDVSSRNQQVSATINRNFTFSEGLIQYYTRIDNGYGGPSSSHISLASADGLHSFSLSIYHKDSTYAPNNFLLTQVDNRADPYIKQLPLNQTVEYDKWYKVSLFFNSTTVLFYLDGKLISSSKRSSDPSYESLKLSAESADVSFKGVKNQQSDRIVDNILNSHNGFLVESTTIPGMLKEEQDGRHEKIIHLFPDFDDLLLVTNHPEYPKILSRHGIPSKLLNEVYYPDGTIALLLFELDRVAPTLTPHPNIITEATNSSGAVVRYSATANDNTDGSITPDCLPVSGTNFPLGTTTVTCTATDSLGNKAEDSFTVTVGILTRIP
jgi:4-amino-4-deoxy-L-arabinose transferase-like glycosyltransferase